MNNILILSAGIRNRVVRAFKETLAGDGRVIAADLSSVAPAIYDADKAYIIPPITAPDYIDKLLEICKAEKITGLFSLIDPELSILAANRDKFEAIGATPVVSSYELCETSLDKYRMYEMLQKLGIPTALSFLDQEVFFSAKDAGEISYPVFVKPQKGSASIHINEVSNDETIRNLFHIYDDLMIQEYMRGQEYGADVYIDLVSGKCVSIFLKKKIRMRAGETDKSVSVKDEAAFSLVQNFVEDAGYRGMIDIDLFEDKGTWYISEVNPRFGGGYPHAYACGVNFPALMLHNLGGEENSPQIGAYEEGIYMMKYPEVCIRKEDDLISVKQPVI